MWLIRKLYGSGTLNGQGGILPPTDPRLRDLTEEQIELDILLYIEDHPELKKRTDSYTDTEYAEDLARDTTQEALQEAEQLPVTDWVNAEVD